MILQSFVIRGGLFLDFHVLGVFVGRGLLLRREGWLRFARGYNAMLLTLMAGVAILFVGFYLSMLAGFIDDTRITWNGPPASVLLSLFGVWAYLVWQQRVLRRPDVRDLFRRAGDARAAQPTRRFQFSLATLLMLPVLTAVVAARMTDVDVVYKSHISSTVRPRGSAGRQWEIHYRYRSHRFLSQRDELEWVVFFSSKEDLVLSGSRGSVYTSRGDAPATLVLQGDTKITLTGDYRLIEDIDGRYRESSERVTKSQFDAFLASKPAAYTIDALLMYAKTDPE